MTIKIRPIRIHGDKAVITLTRGLKSVIDTCDVGLVSGFNWYAVTTCGPNYAARDRRKPEGDGPKKIYLHRVIMSALSDDIIDHIDGDGLNNSRTNIRLVDHSQNMMNVGLRSHNTSGFKGVTWNKKAGKWEARIGCRGKYHYLGLYDDPSEAHDAYVVAAKSLHGEFRRAIRQSGNWVSIGSLMPKLVSKAWGDKK